MWKSLAAAAIALACSVCEANIGIGLFYTIETIPGSTPQSTSEYSYLPNPIGVKVTRRGIGTPAPGVTVKFSPVFTDDNSAAAIPIDYPSLDFEIVTGPDGMAVASGDFLMLEAGTAVMKVEVPFDASTTFSLTALPTGPTQFEIVDGDGQVASPGSAYEKPWAVRVVDLSGNPVPRASVSFEAQLVVDPALPGVTFNGQERQLIKADANGVATSARVLANSVYGRGEGIVTPWWGWGVRFSYEVADPPYGASATLVSGPPASVETRRDAIAPWVVRVTDASGRPVAGVPVTFVSACLAFGGADRATAMSDANGLAASPLFNNDGASYFCEVRTQTRGVPSSRSLNLLMYVFDPANVVITPSERFVSARTGRGFTVDVAFTESDFGIYGPPFDVQVIARPHGASASVVAQHTSFDSNVATLEFRANDKPGDYAILVKRGPAWTWIAVDQRKR